jgi:predicted nucleotidyltransferase
MINLFSTLIGRHINLKKLEKYLIDKYDLELLVLFGSYSKNKLWKGSDLDIGFFAKKRMKQQELENFMLDIIRLSGFDKINAIDLYFDNDNDERIKLLDEKHKKELSLLQYIIYSTGQLIYEKERGLFQKKKAEAMANIKYCDKDIKKMIIRDKLEFIKKLLGQIDEIENYSKTKNYSTVKNGEDIDKLRKFYSYLYTAIIKTALEVVEAAIKLNRFILNEYYNFNPMSSQESFVKLEIIDHLSAEDIQAMKNIADMVGLKSFLTIDYYSGSGGAIHSMISKIKKLFPEYIKIIGKLLI